MWKLLSGIALVVLLDVAFIWMMAAEPDAPEIAQAIGPTAAVPVVHEEADVEPEVVDDRVEPMVDDESYDVREVRAPRSARRASFRTGRVAQPAPVTISATAPEKLFKDTIIWIGRSEVPVRISARQAPQVVADARPKPSPQASVEETPIVEKRKRSFQSKAFSVIKKPYDLIKAVADKLH